MRTACMWAVTGLVLAAGMTLAFAELMVLATLTRPNWKKG